MIKYKKGNILQEQTEAIINTVNCVGIMGRGIALQFKNTYPNNFKAYKQACDKGEVQPGKMFVYSLGSLFNPKYIINFPTKRHWKGKSNINDIKLGLEALKQELIQYKIKSIAIPPLGCGLGGLKWEQIKPLIEQTFEDINDIEVIIYEPSNNIEQVKNKDIPNLTLSRAALIELINRYLQSMLDPFITLLEIHKLMYFLQEAGQPLKLNYKKALYGPYAENLRHVLNILEKHYINGYDGEDAPDKNINLLPGAKEDANNLLKTDLQLLEKIDRISNLVSGFETSFGLELLATVHWVVNKENKKEINEIIDGVYSWNSKKRKFSEIQIKTAYKTLKEQAWV
ncbi:MAG: macro domain-containing protein [Candidatus Gastranaerophilaceae bacterium]